MPKSKSPVHDDPSSAPESGTVREAPEGENLREPEERQTSPDNQPRPKRARGKQAKNARREEKSNS